MEIVRRIRVADVRRIVQCRPIKGAICLSVEMLRKNEITVETPAKANRVRKRRLCSAVEFEHTLGVRPAQRATIVAYLRHWLLRDFLIRHEGVKRCAFDHRPRHSSRPCRMPPASSTGKRPTMPLPP